jgi:spore coat-associated protein N
MSRIRIIASSPRMLLGSLATVLAAVGIVAGSGANFTSQSANPANTFSAGNLSQSNSKSGAVLTAARLKPGESSDGTVTITNDGDIAGTFSLSRANLADTPGPNGGKLSENLDLVIQDVTNASAPTQVYSGKLGAMGTQNLGSFAAGVARSYKFTVTFPNGGTPASATTGDNAYKGSALTVDYQWTSVS